jgi:hypothetical protein
MTFNTLSVAENNGDSSTVVAVQSEHLWSVKRGPYKEIVKISTDAKRNIEISVTRGANDIQSISFTNLDIESLITYLQDVKTFISEEEMMVALRNAKGFKS